MRAFRIQSPDTSLREALQEKIDNFTKPKGSLGMLEELALQIGMIQQTLTPALRQPHNILIAADHGITEEGVSITPKAVTAQQCIHFTEGGGGINFLCRQHGFTLLIVDAGVDAELPYEQGILNRSIRRGTRNFLHEAAMTSEELDLCLQRGAELVGQVHDKGCNIVSFGEMGAGNTSPSSLWMHLLTGIPLQQCVGAGSGFNSEGILRKYEILQQCVENWKAQRPADAPAKGEAYVLEVMAHFGGYELAMAVGGMLRAAELKMIILVDGFIMTSCVLAASLLCPALTDYCIFGHQGDEAGHRLMLEALGAHPVLQLGLRLGEGSGAVCAYPIVQSAVRMLNEMDSFRKAAITKYF